MKKRRGKIERYDTALENVPRGCSEVVEEVVLTYLLEGKTTAPTRGVSASRSRRRLRLERRESRPCRDTINKYIRGGTMHA